MHVGYYDSATGETAAGRWTAVIAREAAVVDAPCKRVMLGSPDVAARLLAAHRARFIAKPS